MVPRGIETAPFLPSRVPAFLAMADLEGWICDRWEFEFLFNSESGGGLVALAGAEPLAFVTFLRHNRSGWIGNLLVHRAHRGQGLGRHLFGLAVEALLRAGAATVWLTASREGKHLYETCGFRPLDSINRWQGHGVCLAGGGPVSPVKPGLMESLDCSGWGDRRLSLLLGARSRGIAYASDDGFLIIQKTDRGLLLGPWSAVGRRSAQNLLLGSWRRDAEQGILSFLDCPAANPHAGEILRHSGFSPTGSSLLMYLGKWPAYRPELVFSLASMGSMG